MFRIVDEKGNFVNYSAFQQDASKWYYFSETGYMSGRNIYPEGSRTLNNLLSYLIHTSQELKLNKSFRIVPVNTDHIKIDGKILCEEILLQ